MMLLNFSLSRNLILKNVWLASRTLSLWIITYDTDVLFCFLKIILFMYIPAIAPPPSLSPSSLTPFLLPLASDCPTPQHTHQVSPFPGASSLSRIRQMFSDWGQASPPSAVYVCAWGLRAVYAPGWRLSLWHLPEDWVSRHCCSSYGSSSLSSFIPSILLEEMH